VELRGWRLAIRFSAVVAMLGCSLVDWAEHGGNASDAGTDVTSDVTNDAPDGGAWSCESITPDPDIQQTLPTIFATDLPPNNHVVPVAASDDLQSKINAAMPGDVLELEAGATFTGPFTLPPFSGAGAIVIRTATPDAELAMPGARVSPALAPKMAKLTAGAKVVSMLNGAGGYRLIGLEIECTGTGPAVDLGASDVHDVIFDRIYAHGGSVAVEGQRVALIDSYVSGATSNWALWVAGAGPTRITNDDIESPQGDVSIAQASNVEICQNAMTAADPNYGSFQLQGDASNVLIGANVLATTSGSFMLDEGTQENVTIAYNHTTLLGSGILLGDPMTNVVIHDNLFDSSQALNADVMRFYVASPTANVKVDHNTFTTGLESLLQLTQTDAQNFVFTNNFAPYGQYGVLGSGGDAGSATGTAALSTYLGSYTFGHNAIWGAETEQPSYPPNNFFPAYEQAVGFAPDWSLLSTSPYKGMASDGKDIGADIATLTAATMNVQ
jgi:hypothetical protein